MGTIYKEIAECLKTGQSLFVETLIPADSGSVAQLEKRLVTEGPVEGAPELIQEDPGRLFREPLSAGERLIVLGGGHIGLPLAEFGSRLGFSVIVIDDRYEFANKARFPWAKQVLCRSFEGCFDDLYINENDYITVVTRGHKYDDVCLRQLFNMKEPAYLGMIGSRRRVKLLMDGLRRDGFSEDRIKSVYTPIGLSIGAVTPEEIAVSIFAEIIQAKRSCEERVITDLDSDILRILAEETGQDRVVVTIMDAKGSVPRGKGAKMVLFEDGRLAGSIGGGCSEGAVLQDCRDIMGTGSYLVKHIDLTGTSAEDAGMVCGGVMTVLIEDDSR